MTSTLTDTFGRHINYLRMSVTDRCDFRCVYCMSEEMTFLPRSSILTLNEIHNLAIAFVRAGVRKIRLTGGEPLIRPGIAALCESIKAIPGLEELCMTTNGSRLESLAEPLFSAGVDRLNVSLDSLDPSLFKSLTRTGNLTSVIKGIDTARAVGFKKIKLNCVMLKGRNDHEVNDIVAFAIDRQLDVSFIEEMPLGVITEHGREQTFCSSAYLRERISQRYTLLASSHTSSGPSRYWEVAHAPTTRIGFISPHSHNFCDTCNRIRLTAEGRLLLCLGHENSIDLKAILRSDPTNTDLVTHSIHDAMKLKPRQHHFSNDSVEIVRFMNSTGG